jgi:hypothetical protein
MGNWSNFEDFSEPAFKDKRNYVDFDSAMRRFESSRPSQQSALRYSHLVLIYFSGHPHSEIATLHQLGSRSAGGKKVAHVSVQSQFGEVHNPD